MEADTDGVPTHHALLRRHAAKSRTGHEVWHERNQADVHATLDHPGLRLRMRGYRHGEVFFRTICATEHPLLSALPGYNPALYLFVCASYTHFEGVRFPELEVRKWTSSLAAIVGFQ